MLYTCNDVVCAEFEVFQRRKWLIINNHNPSYDAPPTMIFRVCSYLIFLTSNLGYSSTSIKQFYEILKNAGPIHKHCASLTVIVNKFKHTIQQQSSFDDMIWRYASAKILLTFYFIQFQILRLCNISDTALSWFTTTACLVCTIVNINIWEK